MISNDEKNGHSLMSSRYFILSSCLYLFFSILLQYYYRYEGLQANSIGYFTVALEYADGNFANALNGFWPPLISWLLVPFIKLGISPLIASRILNVIAGLFLMAGVWLLSQQFELDKRVRTAIQFAFVPIAVSYTIMIFPDLMLLCFIVFYVSVIFRGDYSAKLSNGVICGLLGSFAYFSKHYALPFFLSHFILMNILHYLRCHDSASRSNVLKNAAAGLMLFVLICGTWIGLISFKYGYFTVGTAGRYNLQLVSAAMQGDPELGGQQQSDPVYWAGLLEPPYDTAFSAWDDPSLVEVSSGEGAAFSLEHRAKHVLKNSYRILQVFTKFFSIFSIPVILAYLFLCLKPVKKLLQAGDIIYPLMTVGLYSAGYTPFIVYFDNVRYFWLCNVLLLFMAGKLLTQIISYRRFSESIIIRNIFIVLCILSFILIPLRQIPQKPERGERLFSLYSLLQDRYDISGNIASNDRWGDTLQFVYHQNYETHEGVSLYYGMPVKKPGEDGLLSELRAEGIDYYFLWGGEEVKLPDGFTIITKDDLPELRIFSISDN